MRKFRFKLETVLTERKRIEDMRLKEWTIAKRFLQALMDDMGELEQGLAGALKRGDELAAVPGTGTAVGMFSAVDSFISGQKLRIMWKGQEIERGAKLTERKRLDYVRARQRREALEKLKERKLSEHREAAQRREAKTLDDIYIMSGAARRRMDAANNDAEEESPE